MNVKHSSKSKLWYTPEVIVEKSRYLLGSIDLDPASDEQANRTVKAKVYLTEQHDGLTHSWVVVNDYPNVFLNPPGNKVGNKSMAALFWKRLMEYKSSGYINQAIFICFSMELLQVAQNYEVLQPTYFPTCIPSKRLHFHNPNNDKDQPSHANAIVYVPGRVNNTDRFLTVFKDVGDIVQTVK